MPAETFDDNLAKVFADLKKDDVAAACKQSDRVVEAFADRFEFPGVSASDRQLLSATLVRLLKEDTSARTADDTRSLSLVRLSRLLSRDPSDIGALADQSLLDTICDRCGYRAPAGQVPDTELCIELQKSLCNYAFHSSMVRAHITKKGHIYDGLLRHFGSYASEECRLIAHRRAGLHWKQMFQSVKPTAPPEAYRDHERRVYDAKLFFIITAKAADMRKNLHERCQAATHLSTMLAQHVQRPDASQTDRKLLLAKEDVDLLVELYKALFNVLVDTDWRRANVMEQSDVDLCRQLVIDGRRLLCMTIPAQPDSNAAVYHTICTHVVNLFTLMPSEQLCLLTDSSVDLCDRRAVMFHSLNVAPLVSIVQVLDRLLNETSDTRAGGRESLVPVLSVLGSLAKADRRHRKYLRFRLLPPLRDEVLRRPDQGSSYRNRLVRLMTDVSVVSQAVAELLFELCKRDVGRMIKYTGYGNAAGLLANHGLLAGGGGSRPNDSDDSDTEEYEALKPRVNPVTGFVDNFDAESSTAGMSEEQKEYEAMKLVEQIDKLMQQGVIAPGVVGEDGRPRAASHVLELTKNIPDHPQPGDESD